MPDMGAAASSVFPEFPYERRFTRAEIHDDILPRARRLGDAMRDGKAPTGATLYIPGDIFELWMIHGALAGADVDESKAYIRARRLPTESGRFADAVEWVVKKDDSPEAVAADAEREAQRYVEAMDATLRPEVRDAIRRRLRQPAREAAEYLADAPEEAVHRADRAAGRTRPQQAPNFGPPILHRPTPPDQPEEG
jgi:hypothetical protein